MTQGEKITKEVFQNRFNLLLKKIQEGTEKTPDYWVIKDNQKVAVLEVKDLEPVYPSEETGYRKDSHGWWTKKDNGPKRIGKLIHAAFKQLKNYTYPKIIVFVNFSGSVDILDLQETLNGFLEYKSKIGNFVIKNFSSWKISKGQINKEKESIDLYFWIETSQNKISNFKNDFFCIATKNNNIDISIFKR